MNFAIMQGNRTYQNYTYRQLGDVFGWGDAVKAAADIAVAGINLAGTKMQCDAQIKIAKDNNTTSKYLSDNTVKIQQMQIDFQKEIITANDLATAKQNIGNYLLFEEAKLQFQSDVTTTCRSIYMSNLKYMMQKVGINIEKDYPEALSQVIEMRKAYATYLDSKDIRDQINSLRTLKTDITIIGNIRDLTAKYNTYSDLYDSNLFYVESILRNVNTFSDTDFFYFILSLYIYDQRYGVYTSCFRAIDATLSHNNLKGLGSDLPFHSVITMDTPENKNGNTSFWTKTSALRVGNYVFFNKIYSYNQRQVGVYMDRNKEIRTDVMLGWHWNGKGKKSTAALNDTEIALAKMYPDTNVFFGGGDIDILWRRSDNHQWSNFSNNPWLLGATNKNCTLQEAYDFLQPYFTTAWGELDKIEQDKKLEEQKRIEAERQEALLKEGTPQERAISMATDKLQSFFNDIVRIVEGCNIKADLRNRVTRYFDYDKERYIIEANEFDPLLPVLLGADYQVIKTLFDNFANDERNSIQVRFLKKLLAFIEKCSYDNQEYLLGLVLSFITSGDSPYLLPEVVQSFKTQLAQIDEMLKGEVADIVNQKLYLQYDFNELMKKDLDFKKEYNDKVQIGVYDPKTHKFVKDDSDAIGNLEEPFAVLSLLQPLGEKPLYQQFFEYLDNAEENYFVIGTDANAAANYLVEDANLLEMPMVQVQNLVVEVPTLKNLNARYRFTRYSFFLFLQSLYNAFIDKQQRYAVQHLRDIIKGNTMINTLGSSAEEQEAQEFLSAFENGLISFKKITSPRYVFENNEVSIFLQMGDTLTETEKQIHINAYLRLIYLIKKNHAEYVNEFEFDTIYVVTLSNDKRVDTLPVYGEEEYALQYAEIASKTPDFLDALNEYIWIKDELTNIGGYPITLSVYNRTMTLLKENYGLKSEVAIVNPDSTAKKPDSQMSEAEKTKKAQQDLLKWSAILWGVFKII